MAISRPEIAYVDTIDACHLKCPSCVKGVRAIPNSGRKMPLEMFQRVLDKLGAAGYRKISLYNWTEPFLNRNLEDYIARVKSAGLFCELSTTLSLRHIDNLEAALLAGVDRIVVSISGFNQAIYQITALCHFLDTCENLRSSRVQDEFIPVRVKLTLSYAPAG